jgi:hypothetical protein
MNDPTKDIVISEVRYQLARLNPRDGGWVLGKLWPSLAGPMLAPNPEKQMNEQYLGFFVSQAMSDLPEDVFNSIQSKAMAACSYWDDAGGGPVAMPMLMRDGRWATKSEPELLTVLALTTAVLAFNLMPFFAPGALKTLLTVFPDLSQWSRIPAEPPKTI